jgi:hypothetical protein
MSIGLNGNLFHKRNGEVKRFPEVYVAPEYPDDRSPKWALTELESGTGGIECCGENFESVAGSLSKGGKEFAVYDARLFQRSPEEKVVDLYVWLLKKGQYLRRGVHFRILSWGEGMDTEARPVSPGSRWVKVREDGSVPYHAGKKFGIIARFILENDSNIKSFMVD